MIMNTVRDTIQTICSPSDDVFWRTIWISIKTPIRSTFCTNIAQSTRNRKLLAFRVYVGLIKAFALALTFAASPQNAAADSQLIMVTSDHCPYCQAWERDIGVVYHKSTYAPSLPLTRVYLESKMPEDITFQRPVVGTPTFLIIHDGQEIDRQRGYIDAEMFWWWLSEHTTK